MDEQAPHNDRQKKELQKQLDEFQMLSAIYCNPGELRVDDYGCIDNLTSYISGETDRLTTKLDYRFELPLLPDQKVQILVELPHRYPALEMPRIVIRSAVIPRDQERRLTDRIVRYIEEEVLERDEAYVLQVVGWIQDNFAELLAATAERKESKACPRSTGATTSPIVFERLWIYSHHLKSKMKRQTIIKTARDLRLTGFSRPGKPAIICVEGQQADTQEFWRTIKPLKWQKIQIKLCETETVAAGGENEMAALRHFAAGFREELFCADMDEDSDAEDQPMSMSLFMKFLDKHRCGYIKKELFGFQSAIDAPAS